MSDLPNPATPDVHGVQARLEAVAELLRQKDSLDAESQRVLAQLVEELSGTLRAGQTPPAEVSRLAESTAQLAESLHEEPHHRGLLGNARDHLEGAVLEAEAHAPVAVGLARQLLDALANIGI